MSIHLNSVKRVLTKYGQEYTFKSITTSAIDLDNPTQAPTTSSSTEIIRGYPKKVKTNEIYGDLIRIDDIILCVAEFSTEPTINDQIIKDNETWNIIRIIKFYDGETVALYNLYLRK